MGGLGRGLRWGVEALEGKGTQKGVGVKVGVYPGRQRRLGAVKFFSDFFLG